MGFEDAFERIKKTTGLRTQVEIAKLLDIRQSSISDAKRRNSIPDSWLIKLYQDYQLNPNWIETGRELPYLIGDPDRSVPGVLPMPAVEPPAPPEPTVAELKTALEVRLGGGLRVVIVGVDEQVTTVAAGVARSVTEPQEEGRRMACNAI